jgi:hypothetical protein
MGIGEFHDTVTKTTTYHISFCVSNSDNRFHLDETLSLSS